MRHAGNIGPACGNVEAESNSRRAIRSAVAGVSGRWEVRRPRNRGRLRELFLQFILRVGSNLLGFTHITTADFGADLGCDIEQLGLHFRIVFLRNRAARHAAGVSWHGIEAVTTRSHKTVQDMVQMGVNDIDVGRTGGKAGMLCRNPDRLLRIGQAACGIRLPSEATATAASM